MSDLNEKCLDTFPNWLRSLGEDVDAVLAAAEAEALEEAAKKQLVAGINYLFKSLDLIPDGIDDIGYLDDAFVLRVSAKLVGKEALEKVGDDRAAALTALADDTALIEEFVGAKVYERLTGYTEELKQSAARGRSVDEIVGDEDTWREFASEVRNFSKGYESPSFSRVARSRTIR